MPRSAALPKHHDLRASIAAHLIEANSGHAIGSEESILDLELKNRNVQLVGASRGIGLVTACAFASERCRLAMVARDGEQLATAAREVGVVRAGVAGENEKDAVFGVPGDPTVKSRQSSGGSGAAPPPTTPPRRPSREIPLGRFGHPEEVAAAIVFLASPKASLVVGACLNVDGGQSRSLF